MGLSIKNPETERQIRALAAVAGESLTTAVERAVSERLARLSARDTVNDAEIDRILRHLDTWRVDIPQGSSSLFAELFDDSGLPR